MKKFLSICLVVLIVFIVGLLFDPTAQAFTVRIDAPKVRLSIAPGQSKAGKINVENITNSNITVKAYLNDWVYSSEGNGTKDFFPPGTKKLSCAEWIYFYPPEFQLGPFEKREISYTVNVPPIAVGGYYSVLFFESILGQARTEEGVGVNIAGRIASLFYIDIEGTVNRSGQVSNLVLGRPDEDKPLKIFFTFKNIGNAEISTTGNFTIMNDKGDIFGRGDVPPVYTFPEDEFKMETEWVGQLNEGAYNFVMTLDIGTDVPIIEEQKFEVKRQYSIDDLSALDTESAPKVTAKINNSGNIKLNLTGGVLTIKDKNNKTIESKSIEAQTILPDATLNLELRCNNKLPSGIYIVDLDLTIDSEKISKNMSFSVK